MGLDRDKWAPRSEEVGDLRRVVLPLPLQVCKESDEAFSRTLTEGMHREQPCCSPQDLVRTKALGPRLSEALKDVHICNWPHQRFMER